MELSAKEQAKSLPHLSGVYIMKDENDKVVYVGKAKDLSYRVTS
jgi:excinuclease ABC subunit C